MRKQLMQATKLESAKTLASNFQTSAVKIDTADNVGLWIYCDSVTDNTGTFAVEVRPWKNDNELGGWVALTLSSSIALTNADADFFINLNQLPNCQVRINFTAAGGTPNGSCDIWLSATGA